MYNRQTSGESASLPQTSAAIHNLINRNYSVILATLQILQGSENGRVVMIERTSSKMATFDECIDLAMKNSGP